MCAHLDAASNDQKATSCWRATPAAVVAVVFAVVFAVDRGFWPMAAFGRRRSRPSAAAAADRGIVIDRLQYGGADLAAVGSAAVAADDRGLQMPSVAQFDGDC